MDRQSTPDDLAPRDPMRLLGYVLGAMMVIVGLLILIGVLRPPTNWDPTLGTIFGVVILLFGLFRIATTRLRARRDVEIR